MTMKKIYFLSALALSLAFASCTMEKRQHRNGFYISWNHSAPKSEVKSTPALTEQTTVAESVVAEEVVNSQVANAPATVTTPVVAPASTTTPAIVATPATVNAPVSITEKAENTVTPSKSSIKQAVRAQRNADQSSGPETDKVLLVILAILLPPLAMYLYEGSWTSRCTVNLILTLLCGLPGMIHALVVILGNK